MALVGVSVLALVAMSSFWKKRYSQWIEAMPDKSRMSLGLEFVAMGLFMFWLAVLVPVEFVMNQFQISGVWFDDSLWVGVDYALGVAVWVFYVVSRVNWRRFDAVPLWVGGAFCIALSVVVSYFFLVYLRTELKVGFVPTLTDLTVEFAMALLSGFLFWVFALWTIWTGICGRYVSCLFGNFASMARDDDLFGFAYGWGMPMARKGGESGVIDFVVRLLSFFLLAVLLLGVSLMYIFVRSPDGVGELFDFIEKVVGFIFFLGIL